MCEEEDVLFRPIAHGMYKLESLLDGTVTLEMVMLCNEYLDVQAENRFRVEEALKNRK